MNWHHIIGLGVAGNFTGHLEQAGEASDFKNIQSTSPDAPKGIFPFYVPGAGEHLLHTNPISSEHIRLGSMTENHQVEPEVALLCDIEYQDNAVHRLHPRFAMAHNDCSIRRPGARKISEKKNWGALSKGTAEQRIPIHTLDPGGPLDAYRLASFLHRNGQCYPYGVDSAVVDYSYFHQTLMQWLVERMNGQRDEGPLEDIAHWIQIADYPQQALISIGATRYTAYGESTFLMPDDRIEVALYDGHTYSPSDIERMVSEQESTPIPGLSLLTQTVLPPNL